MIRRYGQLLPKQRAAEALEESFFALRDGPVRGQTLGALQRHIEAQADPARRWLAQRGLTPDGHLQENAR